MAKKRTDIPTSTTSRAARLMMMAGQLATQEVTRRVRRAFDEKADQVARIQQAVTLVKDLGKLKGAAMKAGQILALEARDYLPDEVVQVLEQLQASAPPMPMETVKEILQRELGGNFEQLKSISQKPVAAASIGQVHRAEVAGQPVAIKIQYPNIRDTIESDIRMLNKVLNGAGLLLRKETDFSALLHELSETFLLESDYLKEAENAIAYRKFATPFPQYVIPRILENLSTSYVLTMEYADGKTLPDWMRSDNPSVEERMQIGKWILELYTREFCEWGLVQTDPNLGNFLVHDHKLVLLDFGATKSYDLSFRKKYARLVMAIYHKDREALRDVSHEMQLIDPREGEEAHDIFRRLVEASMSPLTVESFDFKNKDYIQNVRVLTRELMKILKYSPPPKDLIFLHRKLGGIFQMLKVLEVTLDLREYISRFDQLSSRQN